ncbi:MAG TPA: translation initiation factor IF-2, partial [Lachnospiraceae bacterium]|nr:translation initiation factor IF-2 [Lachnospiraceae bacterium]
NVYHPIKPKTAPSQLEYESNIRKTEDKPAAPKNVQPVKPANTETAPKAQEAAPSKVETEVKTEVKNDVKNDVKKPQVNETKQTESNQSAQPRDNKNSGNQGRNFEDRRQGQNRNDRNAGGFRNGQGRNDRNDRNDRNSQNGGRNFDRNSQGGGRSFDRNSQGGRPGQGGMGSRPSFDRNGQGGGRSFDRNSQGGRPGAGRGGQGASFAAASDAPTEKSNRHNDRRFDKDKKTKKDYEEEEMPRSKRVGRFIKPEVKKEEEPVEQIKTITIPESLTIKELAEKMKMQPSVIIKKLFLAGQIVTVNTTLSYEEAENIAIEYDIICEKEVQVDVIEELLKEDEEDEKDLVPRAPVVCVMGHVDHGKTSLLDKIRDSAVTEKEAGGITQKIGAYMVSVKDRKVTFLDTPGHEAFTAMRMRGANSTDIAVLVVAADDGVMPQTVEAINHAKAAGIEIIVAVNKIDKPGANIDRVKQELTEYGLIAEDWGGQTIFAGVSAKTGEGIESLLEMILLSAEVLELKANPNRRARGLIIEAELDKGRGPVATVLVQKGTLRVGDFISAGASHGKVRAMVDDKGRRVKEAGPSTPVEILGLNDVPNAGEIFICHSNDKEAKQYAETFIAQNKAKLLEETKSKMSLDELYSKIQEGNLKELNIIIKADVQGSVEAVKQSLVKLSNDEVIVKVIHGGVGAINESDVVLASASSAIIIGFNVRPDAVAKQTAEHEGVDIRLYKVIYQAIEEMEAAMKGLLDPVFEEKVIGHAEVRQIFKASAIGNIAGSYVLDGEFQRGCKVRITREGEQIFEGDLASLKRFKDDVKEVKAGYECGLVFDGFDQMKELDIVEAYIMVEVPR